MDELMNCRLCEWRCGANRSAGERGVCGAAETEIAYTSITDVLESYSVTFLSCPFRCAYCNAYRISQYPDSGWVYRGHIKPEELALEVLRELESHDISNLSFTGGEPTIHTPYIESMLHEIKEERNVDVILATNGFQTPETLKRIIRFTSLFSFEIKALSDELHRNLTGAPVASVLRNATYLAEKFPEKIRVFRTVVIPGINHHEIREIASFIAEINPEIPYRLIGFRPNFLLYYHRGPDRKLMEKLVDDCRAEGLERVDYSGYYPLSELNLEERLRKAGCSLPRDCGSCSNEVCRAILREPWRV
ncbi:radical SAM protein [Methanothermobacter marburgensis]|uniref:Pyruvate formate-lyase activating related enzyme n=1 Tax=Methanothermobacter marburgensis (strain ATCC BAA-927 / DSM 2133 / JCM 14651 / NBRC 100331 / OCM 82 / Marburg) TaxID=79929 RepID=D9PXK1_METTM|nr:radical SAM protein [Methanothermobacter marburgensis]ADL58949.1 pyruvate formate-lyase activating related enzyme [Methanothermobacter marburgensis str. Marburg]WBF09488.1 radical SAM protein [Methanothermobacter marburgensis]